jgi:hypothetical protein
LRISVSRCRAVMWMNGCGSGGANKQSGVSWMQEIVLLKLIDAHSCFCALDNLGGQRICEFKMPKAAFVKAFDCEQVRWQRWAEEAIGKPRCLQTTWGRRAAGIAQAFRLRARDLLRRRKPRSRAIHEPYATSTWQEAAARMENASRMKWYRKMRSPWMAWAETCSRNQNRRSEAKNAGCEHNRQGGSQDD